MQNYGEKLAELVRDECPPIELFAALFEARGLHYEREGDDEIAAEYKGSWTSYQIRIVWREEDGAIQLICLPEVTVPSDKRTQIYTALGLINEQVWLGHFDLWTQSSVLIFRQSMLLPPNGLLGVEQAQTMLDAALDECERFYPVFQFIIWGDKSPEDAIASALIETYGEA